MGIDPTKVGQKGTFAQEFKKYVGKTIRKYREIKNIPMKELAEHLGVQQSASPDMRSETPQARLKPPRWRWQASYASSP